MNRRPLNSLPLGKAITGFKNYKTAEGLSQRSVDSYKQILEYWMEYSGNKKITQFTDHDINAYLVYMRTEYVPRRWSGDARICHRKHWVTFGSRCAHSFAGQTPSFK